MIQELVKKSRAALKKMEGCTQEQVDQMCRAVHFAVANHAEELAKEAVQETGMGNVEDKIVKNVTTGSGIWTVMKNKKSVGIIGEDKEKQMIYIAHPKGVIAGIAPTTNPTITPLGNAMLALKGRNTIIVSPHPRSKNTSKHTVDLMREALRKINAPEDAVQIIEDPSIEATQVLMKSSDVIVATGGTGMVHA
ncbi:MAG: aldehyde dehydrogenase family protein, partial [Methanobacterium paludis]|nr:aldehyde dehydrogenase family protein [Methanobacterium paludis]